LGFFSSQLRTISVESSNFNGNRLSQDDAGGAAILIEVKDL
jgi:hypothetical protein